MVYQSELILSGKIIQQWLYILHRYDDTRVLLSLRYQRYSLLLNITALSAGGSDEKFAIYLCDEVRDKAIITRVSVTCFNSARDRRDISNNIRSVHHDMTTYVRDELFWRDIIRHRTLNRALQRG